MTLYSPVLLLSIATHSISSILLIVALILQCVRTKEIKTFPHIVSQIGLTAYHIIRINSIILSEIVYQANGTILQQLMKISILDHLEYLAMNIALISIILVFLSIYLDFSSLMVNSFRFIQKIQAYRIHHPYFMTQLNIIFIIILGMISGILYGFYADDFVKLPIWRQNFAGIYELFLSSIILVMLFNLYNALLLYYSELRKTSNFRYVDNVSFAIYRLMIVAVLGIGLGLLDSIPNFDFDSESIERTRLLVYDENTRAIKKYTVSTVIFGLCGSVYTLLYFGKFIKVQGDKKISKTQLFSNSTTSLKKQRCVSIK
ncbi:hypothetical protein BC833DRAFT_630517 [Globomyces pollinis-pini]|nr:hypothetical protein BC833DRAFT_630517 [Globomyces pollinis-pini]